MLQVIKIFEGSFGGDTLYENPKYVTPNTVSGRHKHQLSYRLRLWLFTLMTPYHAGFVIAVIYPLKEKTTLTCISAKMQ